MFFLLTGSQSQLVDGSKRHRHKNRNCAHKRSRETPHKSHVDEQQTKKYRILSKKQKVIQTNKYIIPQFINCDIDCADHFLQRTFQMCNEFHTLCICRLTTIISIASIAKKRCSQLYIQKHIFAPQMPVV